VHPAANPFDAEYFGHTTVHPVGLVLLLVMGAAMLMVRRERAFWPVIVIVCLISPAQRIMVLGANFDFLRVMIVFGWLRVLMRGESQPLRWHALDLTVIAWAIAHIAFALLRVGLSTLVNKLGFAFDVVGMYLLVRVLVRSWDDVRSVVLGFSLISLPLAAAFLVETLTARNMFAAFGGVPHITLVRDGKLRCQGAFAHPILAGLTWASLAPLMAVQWWQGTRRRWLAVASCCAAMFIVIACASATPLTGVMFAMVGGAAFFVRGLMRLLRWTLLAILICLHMVMIAPVWHLISRIDLVGGNSGYHRFLLVDSAIKHAGEWWLIGSSQGTAHWGFHMFDVANQYIVQGLHGGVVLLSLFVATIAFAFRAVGYMWRAEAQNRQNMLLAWALGVSVLVHATAYIAISYFGQINIVWYMLLGMIGSAVVFSSPAAVARAVSRKSVVVLRRMRVPISPPALPTGTQSSQRQQQVNA